MFTSWLYFIFCNFRSLQVCNTYYSVVAPVKTYTSPVDVNMPKQPV